MNVEDALIRGLLRGGSAAIPVGFDAEAFVHAARLHRVLPILDHALAAMPGPWPAPVREACHGAYVDNTVSEVVQRAELARMLEAFAAAGSAPLLMKGAALAYTHYPDPALRFREDTDLWVREGEVDRAGAVLRGLGYAQRESAAGPTSAFESSWDRADANGYFHHVDLHWRLNNSTVLGRALAYDEAAACAVPVPVLGPHARTLSPVHALLLACIHRAGHLQDRHWAEDPAHPGGERLVWFQDMRLLAERFTAADWAAFVGLARERRMREVCRDALQRALRDVGAPVPRAVLEQLAGGAREASARFLDGRPGSRLLGEFGALGWGARLRWLRELAFPPASHIRRKYPEAAFAWLPWLYARRGFEGAWKLAVPRRRD